MSQIMRLIGRAFEVWTLAILFIALAFFAAGCSGGSSTYTPPPAPPHSIEGGVHSGIAGIDGGEIPIIDATVTVYAAGTAGYGSAPTQLGQAFTDNDGNFKIQQFACPMNTSQIYLVATNGVIKGGVNPAIAFMTAVGTCGNLAFTNDAFSTDLDELTTVASTYALSQYMNPSNPTQIGSGAFTLGLNNAMASIPNLANFDNGKPAAFITTAPNSPMMLDTLSNVLAACVQSGSSTSTACTTLLTGVQPPPGAPAATNTLMAALDMARNPAFNVAALFALQPVAPPYQPTLAQAPSGWLLPVIYTGGGLNIPDSIAVDSNGAVWAGNGGRKSLSKFSSTGVALSPATGYTGGGLDDPIAIAIAATDNVWVANINGNSISEFSNGGTPVLGPITGVFAPAGIAIDIGNDILVSSSSSLVKFSSNGALIGSVLGPSGANLLGVAIDGNNNAWISTNGGLLGEFAAATLTPAAGQPFGGGGLFISFGVAVDASNNVWVNNLSSVAGLGGLSKFSSTGVALSPHPTGFTGGGENGTGWGIAIDSAGNVWSTNTGSTGGAGSSVSETNNTGVAISPATGFTEGGLNSPHGIALDDSGNVWIANSGASSLVEYLGAASPVFTPLLLCSQLQAVAVCKP